MYPWDEEQTAIHQIPLATRVELVRQAAKEANAFWTLNCFIFEDSDGFTGYRWEKYNVTRVIVCAANKYGDFIVHGARHYSVGMHFTINMLGKEALMTYAEECGGYDIGRDQGFIDQYGTYYSRADAMKLCLENGQPLDFERGPKGPLLYSEHLY